MTGVQQAGVLSIACLLYRSRQILHNVQAGNIHTFIKYLSPNTPRALLDALPNLGQYLAMCRECHRCGLTDTNMRQVLMVHRMGADRLGTGANKHWI
jgi:hypothetical protein